MKLPEVAGLALAFLARLITGAQGHWYGCPPKAEQRIYFANHQSHFDWVLIWAALPRDLRAVTRPIAARDYWTDVAAQALDHARDLQRRLRRADAAHSDDEDPLEPLMEALRHGDSLVIFPEGTRGHPAEPAPFKSGLYALAQAFPEVQLIPAWIDNVQRVMPKGEVVPVPILCTGDLRRADRAGSRTRSGAPSSTARAPRWWRCARSSDGSSLRSLTISQQVGLLFVTLFGVLADRHARSPSPASLRERRDAHERRCRSASRATCARSGSARCCSGSPGSPGAFVSTLLFGLVSFLALREFVTLDPHPPRRPPQPAAGVLRRAAGAVRAGRHSACSTPSRSSSRSTSSSPSRCQRARQRSAALPRAHRQDPVGHHGLRATA